MRLGVVVIARNEGERLRRCLASLPGGVPVVYVDSGSTDGSVRHAKSLGVDVVELDMGVPFTAARARNAGRARLRELHRDLDAVQFLDGDCELRAGWLETAAAALQTDPSVAVIWGRVRERHPDRSLYNRLCDQEWDTPPGETTWFGGDALIRLADFDAVGGYDPGVIAGEEPDMAWRLRRRGRRVLRLVDEVAWHDADITRFGQWWKRAVRAGHAHIDMAFRHGWRVTPYNPRGVVTTLLWSLGLPLAALLLGLLVSPWWLLMLLAYPAQWARIAMRGLRGGRALGVAALVSAFTLLAKWPESLGYARWLSRRLRGRVPTIIEYKSNAEGPT